MFFVFQATLLGCGTPPTELIDTVVTEPDTDTTPPGTLDPTGDETGTPPTDTSSPTDTGTETGTDTDTDTDPPTPTTTPIDCSYLPPAPLAYDELFGWGTAEDFDFDGEGFHVSVRETNLIRKDQIGTFEIITPSISNFTSGTRVMVTGEIVVANSNDNEVLKIDPVSGASEVMAAGISYPNGVEVSADGKWIFVAGNGAGNVRQLDAITGEQFPVADGIPGANGLVLNVNEDAIFVTTCAGEGVWKIARIDETNWEAPTVFWHGSSPFLCIDGINVDACDNIYFTEYIAGTVRRITPDGLSPPDIVAELPSQWIPNMRWGVGVGGWDPDLLYVSDRIDGRLFAIHTLIPGKKHVLAP